jgi:hypothetical protein
VSLLKIVFNIKLSWKINFEMSMKSCIMPPEILYIIIDFCDFKTFIIFSITCKNIRLYILNNSIRWIIKNINFDNDYLQRFFRKFNISFHSMEEYKMWEIIKNRKSFYTFGDSSKYKWVNKRGFNELWQLSKEMDKIILVVINSYYDGFLGHLYLTIEEEIFTSLWDMMNNEHAEPEKESIKLFLYNL